MADRIQQRRDTAARWAQYNPVLLEGELGWVIDNPNQFKIGDGVKAWNDLPLRGFSGNIVQTIGSDDNAVMSQKAVSELTGLDTFPTFSTTAGYSIGVVVNYNGKLYKFKKNHPAGAWNINHVVETSLREFIQGIIPNIANILDMTKDDGVVNFIDEYAEDDWETFKGNVESFILTGAYGEAGEVLVLNKGTWYAVTKIPDGEPKLIAVAIDPDTLNKNENGDKNLVNKDELKNTIEETKHTLMGDLFIYSNIGLDFETGNTEEVGFNCVTTDYLPITGKSPIKIHYPVEGESSDVCLVLYDKNKNFVKSFEAGDNVTKYLDYNTGIMIVPTSAIPSNAAFMRCCCVPEAWSDNFGYSVTPAVYGFDLWSAYDYLNKKIAEGGGSGDLTALQNQVNTLDTKVTNLTKTVNNNVGIITGIASDLEEVYSKDFFDILDKTISNCGNGVEMFEDYTEMIDKANQLIVSDDWQDRLFYYTGTGTYYIIKHASPMDEPKLCPIWFTSDVGNSDVSQWSGDFYQFSQEGFDLESDDISKMPFSDLNISLMINDTGKFSANQIALIAIAALFNSRHIALQQGIQPVL